MKHIAGRRPIFHSTLFNVHSSRSEAATISYEKSWMLDEGGIWAIRNARLLDRVIGMMGPAIIAASYNSGFTKWEKEHRFENNISILSILFSFIITTILFFLSALYKRRESLLRIGTQLGSLSRETGIELVTRPKSAVSLLLLYAFTLQTVFLSSCDVVVLPPDDDFSAFESDLIGTHFYISNHLRSNSHVLDSHGVEVARFVYIPYGELNESLTTTDPDGDGKHFNITEKYTGQEYDYETGLYNYKARLYDPDSGRFLQTDPKHKDMPGWSNYDRYGYVHGNPINLIDPSGETSIWEAFLGGFKVAKAMGKAIGDGAKWASHGIENASKTYNNAAGLSKHTGGANERA